MSLTALSPVDTIRFSVLLLKKAELAEAAEQEELRQRELERQACLELERRQEELKAALEEERKKALE